MSNKPIEAIDHLLTYVHDLDAAASLFRRMGFTLSPVSYIETMGIANYLVLMQAANAGFANFIELMAAPNRSLLPPSMAQILSGREGIKSVVLSTADAALAHAAIARQGFGVKPPVHVKREWVIGPGESVFPQFDVILPFVAPLTFNCCRYFNVELYQRPEWLTHANGAKCIRAVLAVANDHVALIQSFEALFDGPATIAGATGRVTCGGVELVLLTPEAASIKFGVDRCAPEGEAAYLGYVVEVGSLDVLKSSLLAGGIMHRGDGESVYVDPAIGLGNLIVFREQPGV